MATMQDIRTYLQMFAELTRYIEDSGRDSAEACGQRETIATALHEPGILTPEQVAAFTLLLAHIDA